MGMQEVACALVEAATRHGLKVQVATTAAQALSHLPGLAMITLSEMDEGSTVEMVRTSCPHEGGALHHHRLDGTVVGSGLSDQTRAWIEAWALDMAAIDRFGDALDAAGCEPQSLPPWGVLVDEAATAILEAAGHDAGQILSDATWHRSQPGYTANINSESITAEIDRYLDQVRFTMLSVRVNGRDIQFEENIEKAQNGIALTFATREELPHTLLDAAAGRPLSCLLGVEQGKRPPGNIIRFASRHGDNIHIEADASRHRIKIQGASQ